MIEMKLYSQIEFILPFYYSKVLPIVVAFSNEIGDEINFYYLMKEALNDNGIVCCQGECMWLHLDLIENVMDFSRKLYPNVEYAYTTIPTYPSGQIGFVLCGKDGKMDFKKEARKPDDELQRKLKYYNHEIHTASFVLPQFVKQRLEKN